jgi:hypothetical protein
MDAENGRTDESESSPDDDGTVPCITAVQCSPERTVFTEEDNDDGWISTDTTVDIER